MSTTDIGMDLDVERLAELAVQALDVQPGQVICIWASTHSLDLIEALAYRIRARGAHWSLRLVMESLLERIGLHLPEEHLANVPLHELGWLKDMDAIIDVHDHGAHIPGVSPGRRRAMAAEWIALIDESGRLGVRWLNVINPTPALAQAYGMPPDVFRSTVWQALAMDLSDLDADQTRLRKRLEQANEVHVTSALGTDLHLRIGGRPVLVDDQGLPRGEVYVAPHEDSANGLAVIDLAFLRGQRLERLALRFEAGKVVEINSPTAEGAELLRQVLSAASGDADRIGEFAIGLNHHLERPVGIPALDEKIAGSVHIALGMNEGFGGTNRSNLHLDLVMLGARVWLEGEEIVLPIF